MPVVTRNTLWFYSGDIPYVDFEVKKLLIFFNFTKSLIYCIPDGKKKAIWPGSAKDDGIDVNVREWSWWLIADDTIEMSCSYAGTSGPQFAFYNMEKGINITLPITVAEAKEIKTAVETMILVAKGHNEEFPRDKSLEVLKPSYKVISYPVKAYRWKAKKKYTSSIKYTPVWNPSV